MTVIDTAGLVDPVHAKAIGVTGIIRYLSAIPGPKLWTADQLDRCAVVNIAAGFVFENDAGDMAGGAPAGYRAGSVALWELAALFGQAGWGDPTGSGVGVYFADDHNTPTPGAGAYIKAAAAVVESHGIRAGYYGNETGAVFLLDVGVVDLAWGVSTWGADTLGRCHLRQEANVPQLEIGGVLCDTDTPLARDWGQWPRP